MNRSESINELVTALAKAQAAMTNVTKASRAKIQMKAGGEYSYTYADLGDICEMIRKPLSDNGLAIMQVPTVTAGLVEVETVLAHTSGQWASCTVGMAAATTDPKAIGSAITYERRYGMSLIGVVTDDDDDGQAARPAAGPKSLRATAPLQRPAQPEAVPTNGNSHDAAATDAEFNALVPAPLSAAGQEEKPAKPEFTICPLHSLPMQLRTSKETNGQFYSHRLPDGAWCNGKTIRQPKPAAEPA